MGVGVSKTNNTPLVTLCKERKEFIRAARDARYCLATAHVLYFRSLVDFGNALNQFVDKELTVIPFSSDDDSSSESSDLDSNSEDFDSDSVSDSSAYCSCNRAQVSDGRKNSASNHGGCGKRRNLNLNPRYTEKASVYDQPRFVPVSIVGQDMGNHSSNVHTCMSSNGRQKHKGMFHSPEGTKKPNSGSGFVDNEFVSAEIEIPSRSAFFGEERKTEEISSSPAPPQPSVPAWDFLGLFSETDYVYSDYYSAKRDEVEGSRWREVREREGIPELEDESKQSPVDELPQRRKHTRSVRKGSSDSPIAEKPDSKIDFTQALECRVTGVDASKIEKTVRKVDSKEMTNDHVSCEQEPKRTPETPTLTSPEDKTSTSRASLALVIDVDDSSGSISSSMHKSGSKDLRNIVNQIKNIFETAVGNGKRVSALLEVGRLPHQPLGAKFKAFASSVIGSERFMYKHLDHSNSISRTLPDPRSIQEIGEENLNIKSGYLSSTLEELYVWEKKLHGEVTVEEKLRVLYDKEYKILKNLDDRGAEPSKIEPVEASVKALLSKINVSVKAVDAISRRIHNIRDEELVFQLFEVIHGLAEMWKFMGKCHHKQFWAVVGSKSCVHMVDPDSRKNSSLKATQKLEAEILKYEASFKNYIESQRTFVRLLNEWLIRGILKDEPEETSKDKTTRFSATTAGAPEIFTTCNEWRHEIEKVQETKVCRAIQELASRFRALEAMQAQEEQQRIRTGQIEKELAKQTKNFNELWGNKASSMSDSAQKMIADVGGVDGELVSLRETMDEEKAKHEKAVRHVNDAVSVCLQEGLVPVFEALEDFCMETVKAYQKIRIPRILVQSMQKKGL